MIKKAILYCFNYYGIIKKKESISGAPLEYKGSEDARVEHKQYLKELLNSENERLNLIESKTSQLIGQSSLIFSLLGLFVPVFFDKFIEYSVLVKFLILIPFFASFFFFILTIHNAIKNYNIKNYSYIKGNPSTVCKNNSVDEFHIEEIKDLISSIRYNTFLNNDKGSNLLHAFRAFRMSIYSIALMGLVIGIMMMFMEKEESTVKLDMPIEVRNLDSRLHEIKSAIIESNKRIEFSLKQIKKDTIR